MVVSFDVAIEATGYNIFSPTLTCRAAATSQCIMLARALYISKLLGRQAELESQYRAVQVVPASVGII